MQLKQLWIVWGVLLASLAIYGMVPFFPGLLPPRSSEPGEEFRTLFVAILAVIALFTGIGSLAIRHLALVRPLRSGALDLQSGRGVMRFFVVSLLSWTLAETIGVYGLVLYSLFRAPAFLYAFLAAAALLIVLQAPRLSSFQRRSPADLARPDVKIGT